MWWLDSTYDSKQPMNFPRRDNGRQAVIRLAPTKDELKKAPKNEMPAHHRVRVFVGR